MERLAFKLPQSTNEILTTASKKLIEPPLERITRSFIHGLEKNILEPMQVEYPPGFYAEYIKSLADPNTFVAIIGNHQSHSDVIALAKLSKDITTWINRYRYSDNQYRGFMLATAASMETGDQNPVVKQYHAITQELVREYYLSFQPFVRKKDAAKNPKASRTTNIKYLRKIDQAIKMDDERTSDGVIWLPEGGIQGGRKIKNGHNKGKIHGIQPFVHDGSDGWEGIHNWLDRAVENGRNVIIVPVGIHGGYRISNPSFHSLPTFQAIDRAFGFTGSQKLFISARIGEPIFYENLRGNNPESTAALLEKRIAQLVPEEARGTVCA
jgi:1-acyl-sn-glycerol-3-phosphate acyltransferase